MADRPARSLRSLLTALVVTAVSVAVCFVAFRYAQEGSNLRTRGPDPIFAADAQAQCLLLVAVGVLSVTFLVWWATAGRRRTAGIVPLAVIDAIVVGGMVWSAVDTYIAGVRDARERRESQGRQLLHEVMQAERQLHQREKSYWVGDIAGLLHARFGLRDHLWFDPSIDLAPLPDSPRESAHTQDWGGWRARAVRAFVDERGETVPYDDGSHRNATGFAFCAVPPQPSLPTFVVTQEGVIWMKALGGAAVDTAPADFAADGWLRTP